MGRIATEALLFQTGYLTVVDEELYAGIQYYRLGYPNREVRRSFNESLLDYLTGDASRREAHSIRLGQLLRAADFAGLEELVHAFFASIPYEWHRRNEIACYEGYYASVFYSYFAGLGLDVRVEESGSHGRLDMAVRERAGPGAAMAQLQERGYADKYRHLGEAVHLVAVEFSAETWNVTGFEAELA